ncbi:4'-phosphopantetheinyl transferase [Hydrococcus rivularis NIES-593]|uniref:4'-phosphopantetheinyl transferase n=1 Tax=Hydrococcus rivularis NIES-593 TaxID=1921803 RepID=A0A1U7HKT8_9CYAN|nr:4'-phosphopantetheinyl transferase superfamily protein [Hydrococcus rivularis]OKH24202.1 4'-phosphopantetheinyl transferase [Hydrococcus rivularis NIES-593]
MTKKVDLWLVNLDLSADKIEELAHILSADEKARAERFYFQQHRHRYIVARGTLRRILGHYLAIAPNRIEFEYSSRGKPKLAQSFGANGMQFNLSHSQDLALYGFARDRAIGVDLEYIRPITDAQTIAQRFFSARESAIIDALPESERLMAFFRGWTAKEAYLKATGDGLAGSLDRVEVSLAPNEPMRLLAIDGDVQAAARWHLHAIAPATNYVATVAVEGQSNSQLTIRNWQLS